MTDFSVTKAVVGVPVDTRWRAGKHGQDAARPGQLDASKFTDGTHYNIGTRDDNIIPSGVAVGQITASGKYGPYDSTAEDGRETLAGFINDDGGVTVSTNATFALLVHGIVKASMLPISGQRTAVKTADTTGSFIYVED